MRSKWFKRFGDIPGFDYETPAGIDRSRLPRAEARPNVSGSAGFDDTGEDEFLSWETRDGWTSASPAHERAFEVELSAKPTDALLRHLHETLELPGEAKDYHFAIQGVIEELWGRRRLEPQVLDQLEALCWLNINFIRAHPAAASNEYRVDDETARFYAIRAFHYLAVLYEREGAWQDALAVIDLGLEFDQPVTNRDGILERIEPLDAEGAG